MTRSARQAGDPALARIERVVSRIREVYGREAITVDLERDASPDVTDSSVSGRLRLRAALRTDLEHLLPR